MIQQRLTFGANETDTQFAGFQQKLTPVSFALTFIFFDAYIYRLFFTNHPQKGRENKPIKVPGSGTLFLTSFSDICRSS